MLSWYSRWSHILSFAYVLGLIFGRYCLKTIPLLLRNEIYSKFYYKLFTSSTQVQIIYFPPLHLNRAPSSSLQRSNTQILNSWIIARWWFPDKKVPQNSLHKLLLFFGIVKQYDKRLNSRILRPFQRIRKRCSYFRFIRNISRSKELWCIRLLTGYIFRTEGSAVGVIPIVSVSYVFGQLSVKTWRDRTNCWIHLRYSLTAIISHIYARRHGAGYSFSYSWTGGSSDDVFED